MFLEFLKWKEEKGESEFFPPRFFASFLLPPSSRRPRETRKRENSRKKKKALTPPHVRAAQPAPRGGPARAAPSACPRRRSRGGVGDRAVAAAVHRVKDPVFHFFRFCFVEKKVSFFSSTPTTTAMKRRPRQKKNFSPSLVPVNDRLRVSVLELGRVLQELESRMREEDPGQQGLEPVGGDHIRRRMRRRRRGRGAGRGGRASSAGSVAAAAAPAPVAAASSSSAPTPTPSALPSKDVKHPGFGARSQASVRLHPPPQGRLGDRRAARPGRDEPRKQRVS